MWRFLVLSLCSSVTLCDSIREEFLIDNFHTGQENADDFTNDWAVRIGGGEDIAQLLALEMGYIYSGKIPGFKDTYLFRKGDHVIDRRAGEYSEEHKHKDLAADNRITWAEQLFNKQRDKRDYIVNNDKTKYVEIDSTHKLSHPSITSEEDLFRVKRYDMEIPEQRDVSFNDELWDQEWYLQDTRTDSDLPRLDLNVLPVYKMGYTGKGIKVTILDDGIEYDHDDLKDNYDASISWDSNDGDDDPKPRYDTQHNNGHGTRCAGEIAMVANNRKCGVGVAFQAKVGGVRLLDGRVNDKVEGEALGFAYDKVDIYSASWGPNDDGKTVEGPGRLAQAALERGIKEGRNGKGAIFIWANGNGGTRHDNCNCDGYAGSIYTVSIGSASQRGAFPWYGEICPSTLAVTYSSGAYEDQMITTTDLRNSCTVRHTGTSASAPLAAGIVALALEANPNLTWRDVQHLIIWTSEYAPVADNLGWQVNRAGFRFDIRFGFGLMNAHSLVSSALNWTTVPEKSICLVKGVTPSNFTIYSGKSAIIPLLSTGCSGTENEVNFLEHVELNVNILYTVRGSLELYLTSPGGTRIQLLSPRKLDNSKRGFINWRLMSVGTWGEKTQGTWIAEVIDKTGSADNRGYLGPFTLYLHGTKALPDYMKNGPRKYNYNYNIQQLFEVIDSNINPGGLTKIAESETKPYEQETEKDDTEEYYNMIDNIMANEKAYSFEKLYNYLSSLKKKYNENKSFNRVHHQLNRLNADYNYS